MKKSILSICALSMSACALAQSWPEVQREALPGTRWWWLGSAVDSVNIAWSIDQYGSTGIGSVEITPIYGVQGNDANDIQYLSPEWMKQLRNVQEAAARNGMLVDMNQGTGWPFGGPEVTLDYSACKVFFLVDTVAQGASPVKPIPEKEEKFAKPIAESRRTLPSGQDEVIRAFESRTRQAVKRAAPGGEGLVIDHFDRDAVATYLSKFDKAFSESGTPYPHNFFNDSYEVYGANWTPMLFDEFEKRRGYSLKDKMPELLGLVDDGNQVLSDYRETLGELLLENFTQQWVQWAHDRGVQVRNQAHGSPANLIDVYAAVDVPEIEGFGLSDFGIKGLRRDPGYTKKNDSDVSMLKYASSAAHITGKPLTSSETFTWLTEHFRTSLSQMKPDLDLMFTCGVNHVFFHGTAYSPKDDPWPGWKFYASVDMSPTNSIWRDAPEMMDYITRSQSFLQSGKPDNDFLVYLPIYDLWHQRLAPGEKGLTMAFSIHDMGKFAPDFIASVMEIDSLGYDCDYISDKYLMGTTFSDGHLVTEAGTPYKALIVPGSGKLSPALKAHLDDLKTNGANIIYGIDDKAMAAAASPEKMRVDMDLRAIRRSDSDGYHYFIANLTPDDKSGFVPVAVDFTDALWFDPMTGDVSEAEISGKEVKIDLRSGESRILRLYDHNVDKSDVKRAYATHDVYKMPLDGKWQLTFVDSTPAVEATFDLDSPEAWTTIGDGDLDDLMGTGVYTTTFDMPADKVAGHWSIELGDVRESARVYLNDVYVGTVWAVPFVLDLGNSLRAGKNTLRIEVTNLPANRIAMLDREGVKWRKFKEINVVDLNYKKNTYDTWDTVPSGLNSPVHLVRRR